MKTVRISDEAYNFLSLTAKKEKRSIVGTLDLFVQLFKEGQDVEVEEKSLSSANKRKIKD